MFPLDCSQFLKSAAAGTLVVLSSLGTPTRAGELTQNLGPVGPNEPILTSVGSKRVIAFYVPGSERCTLRAVVWDTGSYADKSVARVRISLEPGQIVHIDSAESESLNLQCGSNAATLAIVETDELVASGITIPQSVEPVKAGVSGF
jgi:hypothetical protein